MLLRAKPFLQFNFERKLRFFFVNDVMYLRSQKFWLGGAWNGKILWR